MRLDKIKISNFRCFDEKEQTIKIDDLTTFIGNNSTGKTAVLQALNIMFSENNSDHILKRSDFHLPKDKLPDEIEKQEMYIETVFKFDELSNTNENSGNMSIPPFFEKLVVDNPDGSPYLRIRLEALWEKSSNPEGSIEYYIYYITCSEQDEISEDAKKTARRYDLNKIRVIYVPAIRDPNKQLKVSSGTMMYSLMNNIKWSEQVKENISKKIENLNSAFLEEKGIKILNNSILSQWTSYDSDKRYSKANLHFNSTNLDASIKNAEVVFSPALTEKECTVNDMSDGLRSLFYISMVDSLLNVENEIQKELDTNVEEASFNINPPILTIIALEEPENHIAPHLIGKLISNIKEIANKSNAQAIITSHSTAVIKRIDPENLRYFRFNQDTFSTKVKSISLPDSEKYAEQYKYIKEAVKAYPELYFAKLVILGEGESEEIILPKLWSIQNEDIDNNGISVVPLGGRHVNHFWRLLENLDIPYITLLDLDIERYGGGWGRIKYALNQLIEIKKDSSDANNFKKDLLTINNREISDKELSDMHNKSLDNTEEIKLWIDKLETHNIYYAYPLDIDFLMLEHYNEFYKKILSHNEGPRLKINENVSDFSILDIESNAKIYEQYKNEYNSRVKHDVSNTLKNINAKGATYTEEQKKLMIWYTYFFLNRGKPSTHIEAISKMKDEDFKKSIPHVFEKIMEKASELLKR